MLPLKALLMLLLAVLKVHLIQRLLLKPIAVTSRCFVVEALLIFSQ